MAKVVMSEYPWEMVPTYPECPYAGISPTGKAHFTRCNHPLRVWDKCGTYFVTEDDRVHGNEECPFDAF